MLGYVNYEIISHCSEEIDLETIARCEEGMDSLKYLAISAICKDLFNSKCFKNICICLVIFLKMLKKKVDLKGLKL